MVPRVKDFLDFFEEIAPSALAESWDNPGLQAGSISANVSKAFVALDPTVDAADSAIEAGAQLLITHHPLLFRPLSRIDSDSYPGNVIRKALNEGLSIISAHTNLDSAKGGINDILASILDLTSVVALEQKGDDAGTGMGRVGDLAGPVPLEEFAATVKKLLGLEIIRIAGHMRVPLVKRVAVVRGSGGSLLNLAAEKGAQVLITGDIGYHNALDARSAGIILMDAGHFATEKMAMNVFAGHLKEEARERGWDVTFEIDMAAETPFFVI